MTTPNRPRRAVARVPAVVIIAVLMLAAAAPPTAAQDAATSVTCGGARADSAVTRFATAVVAARRAIATDAGRLWGVSLGQPAWLGVERVGGIRCAFATADPHDSAFERTVSSSDSLPLWVGVLPSAVNPANTSISWAGRRWAAILLPIAGDSAGSVRLLLHEAMHTLQSGDGGASVLPTATYMEGTPGAALLDEPAGRIWLRLEERALRRALRVKGSTRTRAARDALLFRAERYAVAAPDERRRERALDVQEGLPEYTAWALTSVAPPPQAVMSALAAADSAMADSTTRSSVGRSFPYVTGPAYGYLLDALSEGWRARVRRAGAAADLQSLLAAAVTPMPAYVRRRLEASLDSVGSTASDSAQLLAAATRAGAGYGLAAVRRSEDARWARQMRRIAALRERYVVGPTIRLRPKALSIVFDPRTQTSLGTAGTVMGGIVWRGAAGDQLDAPAGALVSPDWTELRVPAAPLTGGVLQPGVLQSPIRWQGDGWTLTLSAGWHVAREGSSWVLTPP